MEGCSEHFLDSSMQVGLLLGDLLEELRRQPELRCTGRILAIEYHAVPTKNIRVDIIQQFASNR